MKMPPMPEKRKKKTAKNPRGRMAPPAEPMNDSLGGEVGMPPAMVARMKRKKKV